MCCEGYEQKNDLAMTLLLCSAFSILLCPRGHDTAGEEYEENQTESITTLSTILYPITKAYHAQFVSVIPLLEGLQKSSSTIVYS